jgi:CRP-like cAMP-binding protein
MAIMESDLFKGVSQRFITRIAKGAEEISYDKGALIFERGREASHFCVLASGDVRIEVVEGQEALTVSRPGEVFGWSALVEPYRYTATARCSRDAKILKISRDVLEAAVKEHPSEGIAVLKNLTGIIASRLRYAYRQLAPEA